MSSFVFRCSAASHKVVFVFITKFGYPFAHGLHISEVPE
jgi:hypothetical protein